MGKCRLQCASVSLLLAEMEQKRNIKSKRGIEQQTVSLLKPKSRLNVCFDKDEAPGLT